jgi:hypothetical protein
MSLSELIEKLGKTIFSAFDAMTAPTDAPELAEIRLAVLNRYSRKASERRGRSCPITWSASAFVA